MALLLVTYFRKRKDEEDESNPDDEENVKKHLGLRLLSIVTTAIAIVLFIMTEDMSNPMRFIDDWTIFHVIITAVTLVIAFFSRKTYEEDEEEFTEEQA
jgi:NADH:ubiquinone oxidoreductase subunit 2 (subunit N)